MSPPWGGSVGIARPVVEGSEAAGRDERERLKRERRIGLTTFVRELQRQLET